MTLFHTAGAFAAGLLMTATAFAADEAATPEGYVRTGKTESCLRLNRIDSLQILNETQILVKLNSGEAWLQEPRSCSKLRKTYAFVYDAPTGDLCDTTIIKLTDPGAGGFSGTCAFDKFQQLEKKTAAAD
ncbi:MAG: hypothetical protein QM698_13800 [Micropepsaceae bacterium]